MDVAGRLGRLRQALTAGEPPAGAPVLLVTSLANVRYLTGFTGSAGILLVLPDEVVLVTDGRYQLQAPQELGASGAPARVEVTPAARQRELIISILSPVRPSAVALEAEHVSWARQRRLADWLPGVELVPTVGLVEGLRAVKDAGEVARIELAADIADRSLATVRPLLEDEPSEEEFTLALDTEMRRQGATAPAFETICASGPNAAKPHHRPSRRRIGREETVVIDFGASVDGYRSDMTRTVSVGELTHPDLRRALELVTASQAAGAAAVRAGAACREVDRACREVIAAAGWGDLFVHGTGHGVGLDIHEAPSVSATSTDTLAPGHVVTVEPGVYLPGVGGVRIEDTLAVTVDGSRILTRYPKDL
jgi:Xaa-Pro aminopeptidase